MVGVRPQGARRLKEDSAQSERKTILKGAGLAMAGFLVRPLSRVPFLFIIGRIYGETAFGRLVFAVGLFEAAAAFARLGVRDTLFRFLAETSEDHESVIADCLALSGGLAVLTALAVFAGATIAPIYFGSADLWAALRALAPLLPVFVLTDILLAASRAQRTVGYEVAARSVVEPALLTLSAAGLGLMGRPSGLLEAYTLAQLSSFGIAVLGVARRYRWCAAHRPSWRRMKAYAAVSFPTGLADCMNLAFMTTGVVAVGQFSGPAALGVYGMAQNLETALSKIRQAFDMVVAPTVGRRLNDGGAELTAQLRDIGRWILNAQLPLFMLFLLFGDLVLGLFGKHFATGAPVLVWLTLVAVIDGTLNLAQVPLYLKRPRTNSVIAFTGLAVHIGLCCVLVPKLGPVGAGISMACAVSLAGCLRQTATRRLLGHWLVDFKMLKPIVAAGAGYAVAKAIAPGDAPTATRLIAGAGFLAVYGVTVVALDADLRRRLLTAAKTRVN